MRGFLLVPEPDDTNVHSSQELWITRLNLAAAFMNLVKLNK